MRRWMRRRRTMVSWGPEHTIGWGGNNPHPRRTPMAAAPPENNGLSFVLNWGVVEWLITGIISAGAAVAGWVWGLNTQIQRLVGENTRLSEAIERIELK